MSGFLRNILWATDFSDEAQGALVYAELFAKTFCSNLTAVHIVPDFSQSLYETSAIIRGALFEKMGEIKKKACSKLEALEKNRKAAFKKIVVKEGSVTKRIVEIAEEEKANLIVMGKMGQTGARKLFLGSVANHVLRHAPCPVLVTKKGRGKPRLKKILVPTDFAKEEETEREFAWQLAKGFDAALLLLFVLELYGHEFRMVDDMFETVLAELKKRKKKEHEDIEIGEDVYRAIYAAAGIVDYAQTNSFDLIVMATAASPLARFFLGSTTEKVISQTTLPVFAIPPHVSV